MELGRFSLLEPPARAASRGSIAKSVVLAIAASLLLAAILLQATLYFREVPQVAPRPKLAAALPERLEGWVGEDLALGPNETANAAAHKALNFDDYVFRRFRSGEREFTVYAAYWAPGRMPTRLVASHTPDRCWTENGMRCVAMRFRVELELGGRRLLPAELRAFDPALPSLGRIVHVAYWHTVDGRIYDYGGRFNAVPHPWLWWKDTVAQAVSGSREQLFVRIASEIPLEQLWRDAGFRSVAERVAELGLWSAP